MGRDNGLNISLFYCQNVAGGGEGDRQDLELKYRDRLRLFPMPCSGRVETIHLLRALEEISDVAYVITCPEGTCRYFEGNLWVRKRVERAKTVIADIGLEPERLGIISDTESKSLDLVVREVLEMTEGLKPSPALKR